MHKAIKLNYPVTIDGHQYQELTMRRPKVKDRLMVDKTDMHQSDSEVHYFSHLCEVAPEVIEELDWSDFIQLRENLQLFLDTRPKS